jgi:hypothetical protein
MYDMNVPAQVNVGKATPESYLKVDCDNNIVLQTVKLAEILPDSVGLRRLRRTPIAKKNFYAP